MNNIFVLNGCAPGRQLGMECVVNLGIKTSVLFIILLTEGRP